MEKFVSWDVSYDVGVPHVDKQHRHLVDLINSLYNACLGEKAELEETFKSVMKELVEYVKSVNAYKNGKQFVPNSFVRFLRDWLFNHILIDDKAWSLHYFSVKK